MNRVLRNNEPRVDVKNNVVPDLNVLEVGWILLIIVCAIVVVTKISNLR